MILHSFQRLAREEEKRLRTLVNKSHFERAPGENVWTTIRQLILKQNPYGKFLLKLYILSSSLFLFFLMSTSFAFADRHTKFIDFRNIYFG